MGRARLYYSTRRVESPVSVCLQGLCQAGGMRQLAALLACLVAVAGCGQGEPRSAGPKSARAERAALAGAAPPLASLHRQANRLLGGGTKAFQARLRALRGYPVVV